MKVRLLVRQKGNGEAGEIVEVSQDRAAFLFSVEAAEPVTDVREQAEAPKTAEESKIIKKPAKTAAKEEPKVLKKPAKKK